jgi:hypothetical protein
MNSPQFKTVACLSIDPDLRDLVCKNLATAAEAIILQQLRLMLGKPKEVVETPVEGWSADGKTWLPKAPGA